MQQGRNYRRSWLLSCLCCWGCWSELFWSLFAPEEQRRTERTRDVVSATQQPHTHDERRSLLPETPKLTLTQRLDELDEKTQLKIAGVPDFPTESSSIPKSFSHVSLSELNDVCPTCLEPYTEDNPKIMTKCGHHFHLACIYEWLERANTCPVCFSPMKFEELQ